MLDQCCDASSAPSDCADQIEAQPDVTLNVSHSTSHKIPQALPKCLETQTEETDWKYFVLLRVRHFLLFIFLQCISLDLKILTVGRILMKFTSD